MLNRVAILGAAAAFLGSSGAQAYNEVGEEPTPAFFTGERLFEICSRTNYGQCSMYVAGVVDGIFFADGENGGQSLCRGKLTNQEAAKLVLNELMNDNSLRVLSAAAAVKAALADTLSCEGNPSLASRI
jgi:hypothetical protein